jgi:hypothetical protein
LEEKVTNNFIPKANKRIDFWIPLIIFILIGICIFLTERRDGGFVPGGFYSGISVHGITLSKNLMDTEHLLFMYSSKELIDGKIVYDAYNRFPVFPFLLTGILIHPFDNDLSLQIYIARQIMNLFFFLSIIVAYKILKELVRNNYLAISIVIVAFSSYNMLTYNDMIFNDIPALLGFMVALYCVVTAQKTKLNKSRILFYSIFPICLGWQPFAVYGTWLIVDTAELMLNKKTNFRVNFHRLLGQSSVIISGLAILCGVSILGFQLLNEWRIVGGSFSDLPSVSSALWRSGISSATGHTQFLWLFDWWKYLPSQTHSITSMLVPFWPVFQVDFGINASIFIVISVIIYTLLRYIKDKSSINKLHLILIFSGIPWAIVMKQFVAMHEFQSLFYVGFTISVFTTIFSRLNLQTSKLLALNLAIFFLIAVTLSNHYKTPNLRMSRIANQFDNINNKLPEGTKVYFDGDRYHVAEKYAVDFYLVGHWFTEKKNADYAISDNPDYNGVKLTSNAGFNLYKIKDKKITTSLKNN